MKGLNLKEIKAKISDVIGSRSKEDEPEIHPVEIRGDDPRNNNNPYVIMAKMKKIMDANPRGLKTGSLEALKFDRLKIRLEKIQNAEQIKEVDTS